MESNRKDLPALFCSLFPEGSFPGVLLTNSLNDWSSGFLKVKVLTLVFTNANERFTSCVTDAFISYSSKEKQNL